MENLEDVQLGGRHVSGSVLFADIVGYTEMTRQLTPADTAQLLNEYFSHISRASALYHGTVDKFMGDCAMLVFDVPEHDDEHCYHAVACGVLIQRLVDELNAMRASHGLFPVRFRLGINTGEMLAGNLGSRERMEYTVVGDAVNLASRLCDVAQPGELVISEAVYRCCVEDKQTVEVHGQRTLRVKNVPDEVLAYGVSGLGRDAEPLLADQLAELLVTSAVA